MAIGSSAGGATRLSRTSMSARPFGVVRDLEAHDDVPGRRRDADGMTGAAPIQSSINAIG